MTPAKAWVRSSDILGQIKTQMAQRMAGQSSNVNSDDSAARPPSLPEPLIFWLARLRLLYGVPFIYMVPDSRILPPETIRFFYIDREWQDKMVEGALSAGSASTRDMALIQAAFAAGLIEDLDNQELNVRRTLKTRSAAPTSAGEYLHVPQPKLPGQQPIQQHVRNELTGFLLRSRLVSGWPGLTVVAYDGIDPDIASQLNLNRMDRLAPDVLLCIFEGVPQMVDLVQPYEGLHLTVHTADANDVSKGFYITMDASNRITVPLCDNERRVIDVQKLCQEIEAQTGSSVTSTQLAQYLLAQPYRQTYSGSAPILVPPQKTPFGSVWTAMSGSMSADVHAGGELSQAELKSLFPNQIPDYCCGEVPMAKRSYSIELQEANQAAADEIKSVVPGDIGIVHNPDSWYGPRLLVPVDVRAVLVQKTDYLSQRWADLHWDYAVQKGPQVFAELHSPRSPGVYIHWALPDGLTHGVASAPAPETPHKDDEVMDPDSLSLSSQVAPVYPPLPDRWLVARIYPGASASTLRRMTAWVIEADANPPTVTPLSSWRETRSRSGNNPLSAARYDDPAYAVCFDNVQNVFGFYDSLNYNDPDPQKQIPEGKISYLVLGWYSKPVEDPLYYHITNDELLEALSDLGWGIGTDKTDATTRLNAVIQQAEAEQQAANAAGSPVTHIVNMQSVTRGVRIPLSDYADQIKAFSRETDFKARKIEVSQTIPNQILCHGLTYGLLWGSSAQTDYKNGFPDPTKMSICVGPSMVSAAAGLLAEYFPLSSDTPSPSKQPKDGFERILLSLVGGNLHVLDQPDGLPHLESLLHGEGFSSKPGGYRVEVVPPSYVKDTGSGASVGRVFIPPAAIPGGANSDATGIPGKITRPVGALPGIPVRTKPEYTRRPLPRFWQAKDPYVLLSGIHRSYRHGADGRFRSDGKLGCRLTGETIGQFVYEAMITPSDISADTFPEGLPREACDLYNEALLLDETSGEMLKANRDPRYSAAGGWQLLYLDNYWSNLDLLGDSETQPYPPKASFRGMMTNHFGGTAYMPSPVAIDRRPTVWTPLEMQWQVDFYLTADSRADWPLGDVDYEPATSQTILTSPDTLMGRSLFSDGTSDLLVRRFSELLAGLPTMDSSSDPDPLGDLLKLLKNMDLLGGSIGGLYAQLTQLAQQAGQLDALSGGYFAIRKLRIVDTFGRFLDLSDADGCLNNPRRSEESRFDASVLPEVLQADAKKLLKLPPRLGKFARLMFRLLSADGDKDATWQDQPICGWIVPDHLDHSLEMFNTNGQSLGELIAPATGDGPAWTLPPGNPGPVTALTDLNPHLMQFVQALIQRGVSESRELAQYPDHEFSLRKLLRLIDTAMWTIDPLGTQGGEHIALLVGRPLAMVRASLKLEIEDVKNGKIKFPVRLGSLVHMQDGLLGYFVEDNYDTFHPVHAALCQQAMASGPHQGFLSPVQPGLKIQPIRCGYISAEDTLWIKPGETTLLTLLWDPRGGAYITCGCLPAKRIELAKEQTAPPLKNMMLTFRAGPVLTDPSVIRMPLPSEISGNWSWVDHNLMTGWQEDPVDDPGQQARMPDGTTRIMDGWLKLTFPK
jgi:hypothetical protein